MRTIRARGYTMTGFWGKWSGNKCRLIQIFLICIGYIGLMTAVYYWFRGRVSLAPVPFMAAVSAVSAAAVLAVLWTAFGMTGGKNEQLYERLSEFKDTVLFEYDCCDGNLRVSPNAAGQVELPVIRQGLERFAKMPPRKGEKCTFEFRMRTADETYHWCVCSLIAEYGKDRKPVRFIGKLDDISEQKKREEKLLFQSTRDGLTCVYNKTAFEYMVGDVLRQGSRGFLYMIDIDNFKEVNDRFGHLAGDKLLIKIGELLRDIFRDSDLIGRVGGDEFVVYSEEGKAEKKAERLLKAVSDFIPEEGHPISVSIGIAPSSGEGEYLELFAKADQAMYRAKQAGKNRIAYFCEGGEPRLNLSDTGECTRG